MLLSVAIIYGYRSQQRYSELKGKANLVETASPIPEPSTLLSLAAGHAAPIGIPIGRRATLWAPAESTALEANGRRAGMVGSTQRLSKAVDGE